MPIQDYISSYTGEQIDNFNVRIVTLENSNNNLSQYKSNKALSLQPTLLATGWNNYSITISSNDYIATGYAYIVSPAPTSRDVYIEAGIYADNVTINGQMTFHCKFTPSTNITVNIIRLECVS